nr:RNA-directed DNA polymerase, eukaryota [Tanacetum cinerariifolium]
MGRARGRAYAIDSDKIVVDPMCLAYSMNLTDKKVFKREQAARSPAKCQLRPILPQGVELVIEVISLSVGDGHQEEDDLKQKIKSTAQNDGAESEYISDDESFHGAKNKLVGSQHGEDDLVYDSDVEGVSETFLPKGVAQDSDSSLSHPPGFTSEVSRQENDHRGVDLNTETDKANSLWFIRRSVGRYDSGRAINVLRYERQLHDINQIEGRDYVQKSKIKWAIEGDEKSKFFHGIINKKRSQLSIRGVFVDGDWNTDPEVVKDVFKDHFPTRFKQPAHGRLKLNISFLNRLSTDQVADMDRSVLIRTFSTYINTQN